MSGYAWDQFVPWTPTPAPAAAPAYTNTPVPTTDQFRTDILNSPEYKQAMENVDLWAKTQKDQQAFQSTWDQKFYDQNRAQVAGSFTPAFVGSYGAGEAEAKQLDALQKETAAHNLANQQEYTRESLGSRGLASSGQNAVEQNELSYGYDTLLKQIDLGASARQAQIAQAQSNAAGAAAASDANQQRAIANQLADLDINFQYKQALSTFDLQQLDAQIAAKRGVAFFSVADQLQTFYFNPSTGEYIGPGGQVVSPAQAAASVGGGTVTPVAPATGFYNAAGEQVAAGSVGAYDPNSAIYGNPFL